MRTIFAAVLIGGTILATAAMAEDYMVVPKAEQKFKAGVATAREAELLHIQPGDSGIRMSCTAFDDTGSPIEYTESFFPGSLYEFQLTLRVK